MLDKETAFGDTKKYHRGGSFWIQIQINHLLCKWIPFRL